MVQNESVIFIYAFEAVKCCSVYKMTIDCMLVKDPINTPQDEIGLSDKIVRYIIIINAVIFFGHSFSSNNNFLTPCCMPMSADFGAASSEVSMWWCSMHFPFAGWILIADRNYIQA